MHAEDDMTEAWTKYKKFIAVKRGKEQPVSEFIADFEQEYSKAKAGITFIDSEKYTLEASILDVKYVYSVSDFASVFSGKTLVLIVSNLASP